MFARNVLLAAACIVSWVLPRTVWAMRGIVSLQTDSPQGTPTHVCVLAVLGTSDNYVDIDDVATFPAPASLAKVGEKETNAQKETRRILREFAEAPKGSACGQECYRRPQVTKLFKLGLNGEGSAPAIPTKGSGNNRDVSRPVVACIENKDDSARDAPVVQASVEGNPAIAASRAPLARSASSMRVLFVGVSFDAKPMTKSSRAVSEPFLAGNTLSFEILKPPPDFLQVVVLGGSYTSNAGGRSSGTLSGAVVAANLPVHLQCNAHTVLLPPRWPEGEVTINLGRRGPACAVEGAGLRRDTMLPWSSDRVRQIISVRRTETGYPQAIAVRSTPTDALLEAKFSAVDFAWQADPLYAWPKDAFDAQHAADESRRFKGNLCPEVTFPSEGVACGQPWVMEAGGTTTPVRSCHYVCETKGYESFSLPATARFKHGDGSQWEDLLLEPTNATLRGYTALPQRALHVHFGKAWEGLRMQVGLTFEDGRQFYPTVRPDGESILQIPGLRSGATIKVRTFGPRTYEDRDIEIATEHLYLDGHPDEARRPVTIHASLGGGFGLIADHGNLDPDSSLYVLPAGALALGASYAWRDRYQLEGQLVGRYASRPTFPFASAPGEPSGAETFGYFHFSLQGLYVHRYRSWQFGGGPGLDWALPASPSNTDKGGGNDWMMSANLTARWQPSNFTRVLIFIDPSLQFFTDLPVWTLQRDGSVRQSADRHVPFTILFGVRGEWSPFPRSLSLETPSAASATVH